ncbi:MAG: hypothetical protein Q8P07_01055 [bacterium]|nr:hypothetical protein [bacterium]
MDKKSIKSKKPPKKKYKNFAQMIKCADRREIKKILKRVSEVIDSFNKKRKVDRLSLNRPMDK